MKSLLDSRVFAWYLNGNSKPYDRSISAMCNAGNPLFARSGMKKGPFQTFPPAFIYSTQIDLIDTMPIFASRKFQFDRLPVAQATAVSHPRVSA